jgi:hypothetical protein
LAIVFYPGSFKAALMLKNKQLLKTLKKRVMKTRKQNRHRQSLPISFGHAPIIGGTTSAWAASPVRPIIVLKELG